MSSNPSDTAPANIEEKQRKSCALSWKTSSASQVRVRALDANLGPETLVLTPPDTLPSAVKRFPVPHDPSL